MAFGKADSSSLRSGSAIASVQTDSDADKIGIGFYTSPSSSSSQTLSQKVLIRHDGSIGIGTIGSRGATLEVQDIGTTGPTLLLAGATNTEGDIVVPDGQDINIGHWNNVDTFTERLRIDSSGLVYIATPSGNEKLNVAGAIRSSGSSANFSAGLEGTIVDYDTSNNLARLGHVSGASGSARAVVFLSGGAEKMRITSGGTVGINETSPDSNFKLDVGGSINVQGNVHLPTTNRISFGNSDVASIDGAHGGSGYLKFLVAGNEKARLTPSGQLLIGQTSSINGIYGSAPPRFSCSTTTASPAIFTTYSNDVYGSRIDLIKSRSTTVGGTTVVQAGDALGEILFGGADGDQFHPGALIQSAVESGVGNNDMPADLRFFTNAGATTATERMRITAAGRMGIGEAAPLAQLHIKPLSNMSQLLLEQNNATDGYALFQDGPNGGHLKFMRHIGGSDTQRLLLRNTGGLCFGTDNAAANALDDYEEGSWTPDLHFGGHTTGITYSNVQGSYTKIGRVVTLNWTIELSSKGSATGDARIYGYPYAPAALLSGTSVQANGISAYWNNFDPDLYIMAFFAGTAFISIRSQDANGLTDAFDAMSNSDFGNSSTFRGSITYFAAT